MRPHKEVRRLTDCPQASEAPGTEINRFRYYPIKKLPQALVYAVAV
ncbi:MAG: hypothetical protein U9Q88_20660 [Bacillota bacterium]|nr:hypothetical protein [Bacillota bacterium]